MIRITQEKFDCICRQRGTHKGKAREAARLALVDGVPVSMSAAIAGCSVDSARKAIDRIRRGYRDVESVWG